MSITTKILSNSLIGLVSVLPALLVMPAVAGDPYMAGDAFVFGDIVVDGTNGTLIDNMAMGGRRMTGDGVHNGYNNVFPNYSMYGSSIEVQTPTAGTNLLYVGPVSLTLGDLGEKAFRYNFQKNDNDIDMAATGGIVWNEEIGDGTDGQLLAKVASVTEDLVAAGQSVGGVYLYSRKGDGSKSGTLSLAKTNAQIDGATVNAKSISVAGNSKVDIVKQDTSVLNTAERFYTSAGDIANASGITTLNATDTINIDGSQVNVKAGTTLALNSGNDAEDGTTFQNLASDTGALSVIDGSVTTSGKSLVFADNTSSSHGAGLYYKTTAGGVTSSVVLNSDSVTFSNNTSDYSASSGGALFNSGGDVSILGDTSTFTENKTLGTGSKLYKRGGGAIANQSYESEAAANKVGLDATMVIGDANSVNSFTSNTSSMNGGAIMNRAVDTDGDASLTINGTTAFTGNSAAGKGGAIYNMRELLTFEPGEHVADVTINGVSNFANNTSGQTGGAIYNSGNMTIANSTFTGNRTTSINFATDAEDPTNDPAQGGAIYNSGSDVVWEWDSDAKFSYNGVLNISNTNFGLKDDATSGNQSLQGGAIANAKANGLAGEVTLTNTNFYNNKAYADTDDSDGYWSSLGGAIWNQGVMTINGDTEFKGNTAEGYNVEGGAIYNSGTLTINDMAVFDSNIATDINSGNGAYGGAISNAYNKSITFKDEVTFTNNKALSSADKGTQGGAIYNADDATVTFEKAALFSGNEATYGGALFNDDGATINLIDASFTNNTAGDEGGAIFQIFGTTNINAVDSDVLFSGNTANGVANDITNYGGTINLDAAAGRTISMNGGITGHSSLAGMSEINIVGTGTVETSTIKNQTVAVDAGELHLVNGIADGSNLAGSTITVADGATINTIDNLINDYTGVITLNDGARVKGELNFIDGTADRYSGDSGTIYYQVAKLLGNIGSGTKTIQIAEAGSTIDVAGASALFNTDTGMTLASSGNADGKLSVTGIAGGITSAVEATENYNNVQYDMTANDAITTAQTVHQDMVMNGAGTESTDPKLAINQDLTVGDGLTDKPTAEINEMNIDIASDKKLTVEQGATMALNDSNVIGDGAILNKLGATTKVKNSTIDVDVNTAGTWESDPTIYSGTVNNTGIASFDEDTFTSTGVLNNTGSAFLMRGVTFDNGATITGNGTTTLTAGLTHFDDTTGTSNENTISLARGATFDGKLANALTGVLDTRNGGIDTGLGTVTGGKVYVDADYVANKIDSFAGATTLDKINLINSEYGTAETANLDLGGASLASGAKFSGGYYTAMTDNGDGTVTFSDKLLNTSGFYSKLGAWANGNNIKQSSSMDHAADGTTYMSVGQALTALDNAIGDMSGFGSQHYATNTGSVAANLSALDTAVYGKQDTITGAATTITSANLTADKVLISNGSGKVAASSVSTTELGYLAGVTSGVQSQLDNKLNTATAATTYAALASGNAFTGAQTITNAVDNGGAGNVNALVVTATDTDAANGGTDARTTTLTINSDGVSVAGGLTTDTLTTTGDATVGGTLTAATANVTGALTAGTLTAGQTTISKVAADDSATTAMTVTAGNTEATHTLIVSTAGVTVDGNAVLTSASELGSGNIEDGAITTSKIDDDAVTLDKIADATMTSSAVAANSTGTKLVNESSLAATRQAIDSDANAVLGGVYKIDGTTKAVSYDASVLNSNLYKANGSGDASANLTSAMNNMATNVQAITGGSMSNTGTVVTDYASNNYVADNTSLVTAVGALDTAVKANADKIGDVDYSDEAAVAGSFLSVGGGTGTTTVRGALDVLDTAVSTHETTLGDMTALTGAHVTSGASVASNLDQLSLAIDAATTGAVAQAATYTDQRIESIDKNLSAGVAGAVALSSVAVSGVERGEVSVGAGYGYFNGQSAAAFGAAMGLSNRWSVNAGAGISNSDVSFRAGTNYKFKLF